MVCQDCFACFELIWIFPSSFIYCLREVLYHAKPKNYKFTPTFFKDEKLESTYKLVISFLSIYSLTDSSSLKLKQDSGLNPSSSTSSSVTLGRWLKLFEPVSLWVKRSSYLPGMILDHRSCVSIPLWGKRRDESRMKSLAPGGCYYHTQTNTCVAHKNTGQTKKGMSGLSFYILKM